MSANDKQVDGDHYRTKAIQPWDYIEANGIPFLEGSAIKYLTRWRDKGGVADLRKAIHFIEKRIELEEAKLKEQQCNSRPVTTARSSSRSGKSGSTTGKPVASRSTKRTAS